MRQKKTAPRTPEHHQISPPQQSGLIAREKNAPQSATTRSALDNRFHRTNRASAAGARFAGAPAPARPTLVGRRTKRTLPYLAAPASCRR